MAKLILREEAIYDLTDIWNYSSREWSENQAIKYYSMIHSACKEIVNNSSLGKSFQAINIGLYGYKVGKHIIFYQKVLNGDVDALRILHDSMDLKNKLTD